MLSALKVPKSDINYNLAKKNFQTEAKAAINFAADIAKIRYDKTRNPVVFNIKDEIYLKLYKGYKLPKDQPKK